MQDNIQDFRRNLTLQINSIFRVGDIIGLFVLYGVLYRYVKVYIGQQLTTQTIIAGWFHTRYTQFSNG